MVDAAAAGSGIPLNSALASAAAAAAGDEAAVVDA